VTCKENAGSSRQPVWPSTAYYTLHRIPKHRRSD
jgi:hypothetical protein